MRFLDEQCSWVSLLYLLLILKNTKLEICMHSVNELNLPTDFIITQKVIKSVNFNDKLKSCITLTLVNSNLQQL